MKASLTLNKSNQIALFYDEKLESAPEWASIDVKMGEVFLGGEDGENVRIKLDSVKDGVYERVQYEAEILLVLVDSTDRKKPIEAVYCPLMVSQDF